MALRNIWSLFIFNFNYIFGMGDFWIEVSTIDFHEQQIIERVNCTTKLKCIKFCGFGWANYVNNCGEIEAEGRAARCVKAQRNKAWRQDWAGPPAESLTRAAPDSANDHRLPCPDWGSVSSYLKLPSQGCVMVWRDDACGCSLHWVTAFINEGVRAIVSEARNENKACTSG